MSTVQSYAFNNMGHMDADVTDNSQYNLQNSKYSSYVLSNFFQPTLTDKQVLFASKQPTMMINAVNGGSSVGGNVVDIETALSLSTQQERSLEKVQLMERPFMTVPYLGKGSCDPSLESQLLQGEIVSDKKSVSTVMSQSFMGYTLYPTDSKMQQKVDDAANTVEEAALDGWVRGGAPSREIMSEKNSNRPTDKYY